MKPLNKKLNRYYKQIYTKYEHQRKQNNLKVGDLVWALMPLSKHELKKIEKSHQIRPYLIMEVNENSFKAYPCSSKLHAKRLTNIYMLDKDVYKMKKDSYINLYAIEELPKENFVNSYRSLNENDKFKMNELLKICKSNYRFEIKKNVEEGDVVSFDQNLYYVYSMNGKMNCYKLRETRNGNKIRIYGKTYTIEHAKVSFPLNTQVQFYYELKFNQRNELNRFIGNVEHSNYECGCIYENKKGKRYLNMFEMNGFNYGVNCEEDSIIIQIPDHCKKVEKASEERIDSIMSRIVECIKNSDFMLNRALDAFYPVC